MDRRLDDQAMATKIALAAVHRDPRPPKQDSRKWGKPRQDSLKQWLAKAIPILF